MHCIDLRGQQRATTACIVSYAWPVLAVTTTYSYVTNVVSFQVLCRHSWRVMCETLRNHTPKLGGDMSALTSGLSCRKQATIHARCDALILLGRGAPHSEATMH